MGKLTAKEALALTMSAATDKEVKRQLEIAHQEVRDAAGRGMRECALPTRRRSACYEAVCARLREEGFRVEMLRKDDYGVMQDPYPYVLW